MRFAVTGTAPDGVGHDDAIRQAVKNSALGLLSGTDLSDKLKINYFDASGHPTGKNAGGNTVVVSVEDYETPLIFGNPLYPLTGAIRLQTSAVGLMEPFPTAPPRTL